MEYLITYFLISSVLFSWHLFKMFRDEDANFDNLDYPKAATATLLMGIEIIIYLLTELAVWDRKHLKNRGMK